MSTTIPPKVMKQIRRRFKVRDKLFSESQVCAYCGTTFERVQAATVEHIRPKSRDGKTGTKNCVLACATCNHFRDDLPLLEFERRLYSMLNNVRKLICERPQFANR